MAINAAQVPEFSDVVLQRQTTDASEGTWRYAPLEVSKTEKMQRWPMTLRILGPGVLGLTWLGFHHITESGVGRGVGWGG